MINVTKPYLPPLEEYETYLKGIWERNWLTNHGPLVNELEQNLKMFLEVPHLQFTCNGTLPLQMAIKALKIEGEVITTPFSYVATTGAILWEGCMPVFVDILPETLCIDPQKIEAAITPRTKAILATHVFGFPCDVIRIKDIADKYGLKIIYDAAHAFGVRINGKSIFTYGDIVTCSFHATKLFHTIEGGAIICAEKTMDEKAALYKSFGHLGDVYLDIGVNAKNSEFHAAMGLCNLPKVREIIKQRKKLAGLYYEKLAGSGLDFPSPPAGTEYNYAYFPVLFASEGKLMKTMKLLTKNQVNTRRYFYPSLNMLPYLRKKDNCPVSEDISKRILCLPFYHQLGTEEIDYITDLTRKGLSA